MPFAIILHLNYRLSEVQQKGGRPRRVRYSQSSLPAIQQPSCYPGSQQPLLHLSEQPLGPRPATQHPASSAAQQPLGLLSATQQLTSSVAQQPLGHLPATQQPFGLLLATQQPPLPAAHTVHSSF